MNRRVAALVVFVLGGTALAAWRVRMAYAEQESTEIDAGFFIAKNENRNRVHYAVRVDEACAPVGDAPVRAYWRMLERSPTDTEPLLQREQRLYGVGPQRVVRRDARGGRIELTLRAVRTRGIAIDTRRAPSGECVAATTTYISGTPARLTDVFAVIRGLSVAELQINGTGTANVRVQERLSP